jgi:hypothetical protein
VGRVPGTAPAREVGECGDPERKGVARGTSCPRIGTGIRMDQWHSLSLQNTEPSRGPSPSKLTFATILTCARDGKSEGTVSPCHLVVKSNRVSHRFLIELVLEEA